MMNKLVFFFSLSCYSFASQYGIRALGTVNGFHRIYSSPKTFILFHSSSLTFYTCSCKCSIRSVKLSLVAISNSAYRSRIWIGRICSRYKFETRSVSCFFSIFRSDLRSAYRSSIFRTGISQSCFSSMDTLGHNFILVGFSLPSLNRCLGM